MNQVGATPVTSDVEMTVCNRCKTYIPEGQIINLAIAIETPSTDGQTFTREQFQQSVCRSCVILYFNNDKRQLFFAMANDISNAFSNEGDYRCVEIQ